jgi:hypothetical protein
MIRGLFPLYPFVTSSGPENRNGHLSFIFTKYDLSFVIIRQNYILNGYGTGSTGSGTFIIFCKPSGEFESLDYFYRYYFIR